jgi:hypothetical protein
MEPGSGAPLCEFLNFCRKGPVGTNLPDFRHQFLDNIRASALQLGETPQWPVTGGVNAPVEN